MATAALILALAPVTASADTVWTAAGNGIGCLVSTCPSGVLGTGSSTVSGGTGGAAVDAQGNVYFSDGDRRVKRIRPDGVIEVVAGSGDFCSDGTPCGDGQLAATAPLRVPLGLAFGPGGDLFIVDYEARKIRMVRKSDGVIFTIAGNGGPWPGCSPRPACTEGVPATTVALNQSEGIVVGPDGSVYFTESDAGFVRRLVPLGGTNYRLETLAGGMTFAGPVAIALDPTSRFLYFTDAGFVRQIDLLTGGLSAVAGTGGSCATTTDPCGDGGPAASAPVGAAYGMTVGPDGAIYVGTEPSGRIRRFKPGGTITTVAGSGAACPAPGGCGDGGAALAAAFAEPRGLAFDAATGRLWISEHAIARVRFVAPAPGATTDAAQAVSLSGGTMAATLRTDGLPVTYRFEYGPTDAYGFQTATQNAAPLRSAQVVTAALSGQAPGSTTHYRIVATDAAGASTVGADVAFTTLVPGPGVGPSTATLVRARLDVRWKRGVAIGTLDVGGATDGAADLTVTLRRIVAAGTKPVKGWAIRRTAAGAFSQRLALPKQALVLLPGRYRVDVTGSSPGGTVARVARDLRLVGPSTGIVRDGYTASTKNGAAATRLPGTRTAVWAMFRFAALPTKGLIRVYWILPGGDRSPAVVRPRRTNVEATISSSPLPPGRYKAVLTVGGVELKRLGVRIG